MADNISTLIETNRILVKQIEDLHHRLNERDTLLAKSTFSAKFINNIVIEIVQMFEYHDFTFSKGLLLIQESVDSTGKRYGLTIAEVNENTCAVNAFYGEDCLHFRGLDCKGRNYDIGDNARDMSVTFAKIMRISDALRYLGNEKTIMKTDKNGCKIIEIQ